MKDVYNYGICVIVPLESIYIYILMESWVYVPKVTLISEFSKCFDLSLYTIRAEKGKFMGKRGNKDKYSERAKNNEIGR